MHGKIEMSGTPCRIIGRDNEHVPPPMKVYTATPEEIDKMCAGMNPARGALSVNQKKPYKEDLERCIEQGMTRRNVADEYGMSVQKLSQKAAYYRLTKAFRANEHKTSHNSAEDCAQDAEAPSCEEAVVPDGSELSETKSVSDTSFDISTYIVMLDERIAKARSEALKARRRLTSLQRKRARLDAIRTGNSKVIEAYINAD